MISETTVISSYSTAGHQFQKRQGRYRGLRVDIHLSVDLVKAESNFPSIGCDIAMSTLRQPEHSLTLRDSWMRIGCKW